MNDKEFIFYMVSDNEKYAPKGLRYKIQDDALATAERLSTRYGKTMYVIECCMVCNTVSAVKSGVE